MPEHPVCATPDLRVASCPSRRALDLVSDKWVVIVLYAIASGIDRSGRLQREIEGVSQRMLTRTLRDLEAAGLIDRDVISERPAHVVYRLTPVGCSLMPVIQGLCDWGVVHMAEVDRARAQSQAGA